MKQTRSSKYVPGQISDVSFEVNANCIATCNFMLSKRNIPFPNTLDNQLPQPMVFLIEELKNPSCLSKKTKDIKEVIHKLDNNLGDEIVPLTSLVVQVLLQTDEDWTNLIKVLIQVMEVLSASDYKKFLLASIFTLKFALEGCKNYQPVSSALFLLGLKVLYKPVEERDALFLTSEDYVVLQEVVELIYDRALHWITKFWDKAIRPTSSSVEANSVFRVVQSMIKNLITIFQERVFLSEEENLFINQGKIRVPSPSVQSKLLSKLIEIANYEVTPLDLRNSCGLLAVHLETLGSSSLEDVFGSASAKTPPFCSLNDVGQMALFHGLLCRSDPDFLFQSKQVAKYPENKDNSSAADLRTHVAEEILKIVFRTINSAQVASVTILGSRILKHVMTKLLQYTEYKMESVAYVASAYSVNTENTKHILDIIWLLWDHFLDCVKHTAKETFVLLTKTLYKMNETEARGYFSKLSESLCHSLPRYQSFTALTCLIPFIKADSLIKANPSLIKSLFQMLNDTYYASYSINLLITLFTKHYSEIGYDEWFEYWFLCFLKDFSEGSFVYGCELLVEKFIKICDDPIQVVGTICVSSDDLDNQKLCLLMLCTKMCLKNNKLRTKIEHGERKWAMEDDASPPLWKNLLPFTHLNSALHNSNKSLGILAFNLLCESSRTTELFLEEELDFIFSFTSRNIASSDPAFRQKLVTNLKKAINRIKAGCSAMIKALETSTNDSKLQQSRMQTHEHFIRSLFELAATNLSDMACFPRRVTSLSVLELLFELLTSRTPLSYLRGDLLTPSLRDSLVLCLSDSYESNKQTASKLLRCLISMRISYNEDTSRLLFSSIWDLASSSKPPESLTASYLINALVYEMPEVHDFPVPSTENKRLLACWVVLTRLRKETMVAVVSLFKAASTAPMYGLLTCLRSLFFDIKHGDIEKKEHLWSILIHEVISTCSLIVETVFCVVRNSSPEGHLSMDHTSVDGELLKETVRNSVAAQDNGFNDSKTELTVDEKTKAQAVSAQMLLLCGWRSVKEVSLLFGLFVQGSPSYPYLLDFLSFEDVKSIGDFFILQLMETKHRGAFEQCYSGFGMLCDKLWLCDNESLSKLPEKLLDDVLAAVQNESQARNLCPTRRSAGVPFIVQAVLANEPKVRNDSCLKRTMTLLLSLAKSNGEPETQIHALNILRALYRDTRIGEAVIPFVSEGIKVAVSGYENGSWSVRNSSSLMFAALVTRMLGVKRNQEDSHSKNAVSALRLFRRYPDLYDFILDKLRSSADGRKGNERVTSSVFLILMLLARLLPASSEGYSTTVPLVPFIPYVMEFSGSPLFHLRSLASKALVPLLSPITLTKVIKTLCGSVSLTRQNYSHGALLCLIQIFNHFKGTITSSKEIQSELKSLLVPLMGFCQDTNPCYFSRGCCIEFFLLVVKDDIVPGLNLRPIAASCFSLILQSNEHLKHHPGRDLAFESATKLFIYAESTPNKNEFHNLISLLDLSSPFVLRPTLQYFSSVEQYPLSLVQKIFALFEAEHVDTDVQRLTLALIVRIIKGLEEEQIILYRRNLDNVLASVLCKLKTRFGEDLLSDFIEMSGTVIQTLVVVGEVPKDSIVGNWMECMTKFSAPDSSIGLRTAVAKSLSTVISIFAASSTMGEKYELRVMELFLELLVDDDPAVREVVSKQVGAYLKQTLDPRGDDHGRDLGRPSMEVLDELILHLVHYVSGTKVAALISLALKEELPEEFGLSQDEDRAFEKGEVSLLRENAYLSKKVSDSIVQVLTEKGKDHFADLQIPLVEVQDHFLLPVQNRLEIGSPGTELGGSEQQTDSRIRNNSPDCVVINCGSFMKMLKRDIEYILSNFDQLKYATPFSMKHFGLWVERLYRRACVWRALKVLLRKEERAFDQYLLRNLDTSLMRPIAFLHILEWLS